MLYQLNNLGEDWELIEILPKGHLKLFARRRVKISVIKEEKHYLCCEVNTFSDNLLSSSFQVLIHPAFQPLLRAEVA